MDIIQTSKDVLYLTISFAVLLLAVFSAWLLFYFIMMAKQANETITDIRTKIKKVENTINAFKEKVEHSTSYLFLIGEGIKKLVEIAKEYGNKKEEKKKKN